MLDLKACSPISCTLDLKSKAKLNITYVTFNLSTALDHFCQLSLVQRAIKMFEGWASDLLASYLGQFLEVQREQLRISLWSGEYNTQLP